MRVGCGNAQRGRREVEIGQLGLFLPRVIEGVSAINKLNEADLLVYRDDDYIHMQPKKARSFHQYLRELYAVAVTSRQVV